MYFTASEIFWPVRTLQGAQEMFRNLPHEYVDVAHLKKVAQHGSESTLN